MLTIVTVLIHAEGKGFVAIVCITTECQMNCLHVISPMIWKEHMTGVLMVLLGFTSRGRQDGESYMQG